MLYNRDSRKEITREQLFQNTLRTYQDASLMNRLRAISLEENNKTVTYAAGWDETYLNNFMLNRFGNIRISDQTLYHAQKIGFSNPKMQESFNNKILSLFPLPVLESLKINIDKNDTYYSPGDMLYSLSSRNFNVLGGYRVTSLLADGLATFGMISYIITFILLFLNFKFLDLFVIIGRKKNLYCILALINVFGILGMLRNSIGVINLVSFLLRGFWQQCLIFLIVLLILKGFTFLKIKYR